MTDGKSITMANLPISQLVLVFTRAKSVAPALRKPRRVGLCFFARRFRDCAIGTLICAQGCWAGGSGHPFSQKHGFQFVHFIWYFRYEGRLTYEKRLMHVTCVIRLGSSHAWPTLFVSAVWHDSSSWTVQVPKLLCS